MYLRKWLPNDASSFLFSLLLSYIFFITMAAKPNRHFVLVFPLHKHFTSLFSHKILRGTWRAMLNSRNSSLIEEAVTLFPLFHSRHALQTLFPLSLSSSMSLNAFICTKRSPDVVLMLSHRGRRWAGNKTALGAHFVFAVMPPLYN